MIPAPQALLDIPKSRFWFYRPQWYWWGWSPVYRGHDEYSRNTLMLGWPVTGRIIIALGYCGDEDCHEQSIRWAEDEAPG